MDEDAGIGGKSHTHRERQPAAQRAAEDASSRTCVRSALVDPEEQLLRNVLRQSVTAVEMDARRLHRKNAKALQLGIEESKPLAMQKKTAKPKVLHLAKELACAVRRIVGIISSLSDSGTMSTDDDVAPPAADAYTEDYYRRSGERKGEGLARKW